LPRKNKKGEKSESLWNQSTKGSEMGNSVHKKKKKYSTITKGEWGSNRADAMRWEAGGQKKKEQRPMKNKKERKKKKA